MSHVHSLWIVPVPLPTTSLLDQFLLIPEMQKGSTPQSVESKIDRFKQRRRESAKRGRERRAQYIQELEVDHPQYLNHAKCMRLGWDWTGIHRRPNLSRSRSTRCKSQRCTACTHTHAVYTSSGNWHTSTHLSSLPKFFRPLVTGRPRDAQGGEHAAAAGADAAAAGHLNACGSAGRRPNNLMPF